MHPKGSEVNITCIFRIHSKNRGLKIPPKPFYKITSARLSGCRWKGLPHSLWATLKGRYQALGTLKMEVSVSLYTVEGGIRLLVHWRGRYQALGTLKMKVSDSWYTEEGSIRLLVHWRGRFQTLGTLKREVSDSWYTEEGGFRLLVHWRGRFQTLGTLKREVSDSWCAEEGGIRLLVHWRGRYQTLGTRKREVSDSSQSSLSHCRIIQYTYIYLQPLQYQIWSGTIKFRSTQRYLFFKHSENEN